MPLYFAYGSNMDRAAMARRCPASTVLGTARLVRHRFAITGDGYASVIRDPRGTVWGVLWNLVLADVPALDRYESIGTALYAKAMQPVLTATGPRRALIYIARNRQVGVARPGYIEGIVAAGREVGLPADYIRDLEAWSPQAQRATSEPADRPSVRAIWSSPVARQPSGQG